MNGVVLRPEVRACRHAPRACRRRDAFASLWRRTGSVRRAERDALMPHVELRARGHSRLPPEGQPQARWSTSTRRSSAHVNLLGLAAWSPRGRARARRRMDRGARVARRRLRSPRRACALARGRAASHASVPHRAPARLALPQWRTCSVAHRLRRRTEGIRPWASARADQAATSEASSSASAARRRATPSSWPRKCSPDAQGRVSVTPRCVVATCARAEAEACQLDAPCSAPSPRWTQAVQRLLALCGGGAAARSWRSW